MASDMTDMKGFPVCEAKVAEVMDEVLKARKSVSSC